MSTDFKFGPLQSAVVTPLAGSATTDKDDGGFVWVSSSGWPANQGRSTLQMHWAWGPVSSELSPIHVCFYFGDRKKLRQKRINWSGSGVQSSERLCWNSLDIFDWTDTETKWKLLYRIIWILHWHNKRTASKKRRVKYKTNEQIHSKNAMIIRLPVTPPNSTYKHAVNILEHAVHTKVTH